MPSKKKKTPVAAKKPFKVLTRKALIGWMVVIFIACGWMFALGVLVGRDQAPIEYDLDAIEKQLSKLKQRESLPDGGGEDRKSKAPKGKNQLDFYEALPENREDTEIPKRPKPKTAIKKPSPPVKKDQLSSQNKQTEKKVTPPQPPSAPAPKIAAVQSGIYSIQAASVKNKPDAERLVKKLKKRGYPAFVLTSKIEGKGTWHRVRIGPFSTKEDATRILNAVRQTGMKPILVKKK